MARTSEESTLKRSDDDLTPELALVDPELAQRARERLPDAAEARHAAEPVEDQPVVERIPPAELFEATVGEEPVAAEPPAPGARRRRRSGRVLVAMIAVIGAAGIGFALPALLVDSRTASPTASAPMLLPPRADAEPAPVTTAAAKSAPRNFGWVPVERASHYHVAFFRGKEKIFEAWPRRPPLVLQPRWTFKGRSFSLAPGQYRWVVRPGFGRRKSARYGKPVVDAGLVVRP